MSTNNKNNKKEKKEKKQTYVDPAYLVKMRLAAPGEEDGSLLTLLPVIMFSAITILIVRMAIYTRPMSQFYWTTETDTAQITDFFSYKKMAFVVVCGVFVLLLIAFKAIIQVLTVKKTIIYYPMLAYIFFILLSYIFSDYKVFALWGYNDRFEGTIPLIIYMIMVFYIINAINTERDIKIVLWPIAVSAAILSLIGASQALDIDFFRTEFGQKLIVPNLELQDGSTTWQAIESAIAQGELYLNFTFKNREIYQTVYNPNYVSFYLTLFVPVFGMLFLRAWDKQSGEKLWKKIALAALFALIIYNFIGSASSGGVIGIGVIGLLGIVIFNKQLLKWWKPLICLFLITGIVMGMTVDRWSGELGHTFKESVFGLFESEEDEVNEAEQTEVKGAATEVPYINYIKTVGDSVTFCINGKDVVFNRVLYDGTFQGVDACDVDGNLLDVSQDDEGYFVFEDEELYNYIKYGYATNEDVYYLVVSTAGTEWPFDVSAEDQVYFMNGLGKQVSLDYVESFGFENHTDFGTGRGYIWSRSIPMLKNSVLWGTGADTYCVVYPHYDYAGKYNSITFHDNINIIVDKPHNMYLMMGIGTGCGSLVAVLTMYFMYIVQSIKLYWKRSLDNDYILYVGTGIFFGTTAFMATGLVDDSSISTMPLFYTFLAMGIAINMIIKKRDSQKKA